MKKPQNSKEDVCGFDHDMYVVPQTQQESSMLHPKQLSSMSARLSSPEYRSSYAKLMVLAVFATTISHGSCRHKDFLDYHQMLLNAQQ